MDTLTWKKDQGKTMEKRPGKNRGRKTRENFLKKFSWILFPETKNEGQIFEKVFMNVIAGEKDFG